MRNIGIDIVYIGLLFYMMVAIGQLEKGWIKYTILIIFLFSTILLSNLFSVRWLGFFLAWLLLFLFDLFYDAESFLIQWKRLLWLGLLPCLLMLGRDITSFYSDRLLLTLLLCYDFFFLLWFRNERNLLLAAIITIFFFGIYLTKSPILFSILAFFALEVNYLQNRAGFERSTKSFQQNVLLNQYEEIKNIYLNMRGFRHDYHNHLQTMRAYLSMRRIEELEEYMKELEQELHQVDTYVKSGNLMVDAILNSKLSLANQKQIKIFCKVEGIGELPFTDIDLCIILGNLLDNAIEGCEKIAEEKRFLRLYMVTVKKQLYFSIQNSAKEELNFEERNYITTKRGNHGLGMNRVKILVDKYKGYLNLQNEPGIFACEVTMPLV